MRTSTFQLKLQTLFPYVRKIKLQVPKIKSTNLRRKFRLSSLVFAFLKFEKMFLDHLRVEKVIWVKLVGIWIVSCSCLGFFPSEFNSYLSKNSFRKVHAYRKNLILYNFTITNKSMWSGFIRLLFHSEVLVTKQAAVNLEGFNF